MIVGSNQSATRIILIQFTTRVEALIAAEGETKIYCAETAQ